MRYLGEKKRKRKKGVAKMSAPIAFDNSEWEAAEDARALARADAVKCDPDRMARAKAWAAKQLDESKARVAEAQKMIDLGTS